MHTGIQTQNPKKAKHTMRKCKALTIDEDNEQTKTEKERANSTKRTERERERERERARYVRAIKPFGID
jgi:hypothetical protein